MLFSDAPKSATVLQHQRANSRRAFLLPPDVLEAAGLCWRCNILHPAHLWFHLVTVSKHVPEGAIHRGTGFGDCFGFISAAARILHQSDKM